MKTIRYIKSQARRLQRDAQAEAAEALRRIAKARGEDEIIRRRHCLATLAREFGFDGWHALVRAWSEPGPVHQGTFLYPLSAGAHWNVWSANYQQACCIRSEHGGFLLGYRNQYFIAESGYIDDLGLDSQHPDWKAMGRNWIAPEDLEARDRLTLKLVRHQLERISYVDER